MPGYCFVFIQETTSGEVSQIRTTSFSCYHDGDSGPIGLAHDKIKILRDPWFSLCLALISKYGITDFFFKDKYLATH